MISRHSKIFFTNPWRIRNRVLTTIPRVFPARSVFRVIRSRLHRYRDKVSKGRTKLSTSRLSRRGITVNTKYFWEPSITDILARIPYPAHKPPYQEPLTISITWWIIYTNRQTHISGSSYTQIFRAVWYSNKIKISERSKSYRPLFTDKG